MRSGLSGRSCHSKEKSDGRGHLMSASGLHTHMCPHTCKQAHIHISYIRTHANERECQVQQCVLSNPSTGKVEAGGRVQGPSLVRQPGELARDPVSKVTWGAMRKTTSLTWQVKQGPRLLPTHKEKQCLRPFLRCLRSLLRNWKVTSAALSSVFKVNLTWPLCSE